MLKNQWYKLPFKKLEKEEQIKPEWKNKGNNKDKSRNQWNKEQATDKTVLPEAMFSVPHALWGLSTMNHGNTNYSWPSLSSRNYSFCCFSVVFFPTTLIVFSHTSWSTLSYRLNVFFVFNVLFSSTLTCKFLLPWPLWTLDSAEFMKNTVLCLHFHSLCCGKRKWKTNGT